MPLAPLTLAPDSAPLPADVERFLGEATRRIDDFQDRGGCHGFVPSDYRLAYRYLRVLAADRYSSGALFCEWGSGFGVVTCLAAMLGYDACGIEIHEELVDSARALADDFDLSVQWIQGSFIPEGGDSCFDPEEDYAWLTSDADTQVSPDEFDLIYVYPWPDEEELTAALFERFAATGAVLLSYHGGDVFRVRRKTRKR